MQGGRVAIPPRDRQRSQHAPRCFAAVARVRFRLLGSGCTLVGTRAPSRAGGASQTGPAFPTRARHGAPSATPASDTRCLYASCPAAMWHAYVCLLGSGCLFRSVGVLQGPFGRTSIKHPPKKHKIYHATPAAWPRPSARCCQRAGPCAGAMLTGQRLCEGGGGGIVNGPQSIQETRDRKGRAVLLQRPVSGCARWVPGVRLWALTRSRGPGTPTKGASDVSKGAGGVGGHNITRDPRPQGAWCLVATARERVRLLGSGCPFAGFHALSRVGHSHERGQRCSPGGRQGARGAISASDKRCRYA